MIRLAPKRPHRLLVIAAAVVVGGAFAAIAMANTGTADSMPGLNIVRLVLGLILVIGVLLIAARILPRLGGAAGIASGAFRVIASLPVGQRERVVIVQVGDNQMMLGVAPGRVDMLQQLDQPLESAEVSPAKAAGAAAPAWLNRVLGGQA